MTGEASKSTLAKIKSRGHWEVTVRPATFQSDRITDVGALGLLLESMQVRVGGWYFPHIGTREPPRIKGDCIEAAVDFEAFVEFFRFYQSGQFIYISGFPEDWNEEVRNFGKRDPSVKPGDLLGIGSVIYRITRVYEFAARMARKLPGDDDLVVAVVARHLEHRQLVVDAPFRTPLFGEYRAAVDEFSHSEKLARASFVAEPRELAQVLMVKLFAQFQWTWVERAVLRGWQAEIFPDR